MARLTVLQLVQNILSRLDSDSVNSIGDTVESNQVANIVQNKYYDILTRGDMPEQMVLSQLVASNDSTKPIQMFVPAGVSQIEWIKYFDSNPDDSEQDDQFGSYSHGVNTDLVPSDGTTPNAAPGYKYVSIVPIEQFLNMVNRFNPNDDNVGTYTFTEGANSFTFYYKNDMQPRFCTVIENKYILFDSYDSGFDTTLQSSKTMVKAQQVTPFQLVDDFIPDLDDNKFPLLLNEATSLAFYELKGSANAKAEQEIKRQWSAVQKEKSVVNKPGYFDQLANFGRVPRTGGYGVSPVNKWMRGS